MTTTEERVPVRATPKKLRTLLNLAIHRVEQAIDVAETLELTQRSSSLRTIKGDLERQLELTRRAA